MIEGKKWLFQWLKIKIDEAVKKEDQIDIMNCSGDDLVLSVRITSSYFRMLNQVYKVSQQIQVIEGEVK